jgi:hypothetical protein
VFKYLLLVLPIFSLAQGGDDSIFIRRIYDEELQRGQAYARLRSLCKDVGHRLSGSPGAEKAVIWGLEQMREMGYDTAWLQPMRVPRWERGDIERLEMVVDGRTKSLRITTLGMSIPTSGVLSAKVMAVRNYQELETLGKSAVEGKIVFFYEPMDPRFIDTFGAYSTCGTYRLRGASRAAALGAVAVIVRSLTLQTDDHPHTGTVIYADSLPQIPAVAVATADADVLLKECRRTSNLSLKLMLNCRQYADVISYNVVGEMYGRDRNTFITVGGHLDSWDKGEGAHDDGAGVVHSMEALRLLKTLGYSPNYTLRCVLFMNEENGTRGGNAYADSSSKDQTRHYAAIESDRGGFSPRGFSMDVSPLQMEHLQRLTPLLKPYLLHLFYQGWSGVDIAPLRRRHPSAMLLGFVTDSQRYFDFHHADTDVFEAVNQRELELGAAGMAAMVYLIDKYPLPAERE